MQRMTDTAIFEAIERVQEQMVRVQWSQSELARQTKAFAAARHGIDLALSQQSIAAFLGGKGKRIPSWLQYVFQAMDAAENGHRLKQQRSSFRHRDDKRLGILPDHPPVRSASADDNAVEIKQIDLSYAMGDGSSLDEDYPEEIAVKFDLNFLRSVTKASPSALFVAKGDGDSMMPTLINGDMVLIDTTQKSLKMQDRIWACTVHGAGMIKRLRVIGDGRVEVRSDNKTVGDREVDASDLHIVGRVIWVGRRV